LRIPEQLPILLAGPVVRRIEPTSATIWVATSIELVMRCSITDLKSGAVLGLADALSFPLGEKLFINLATVNVPAGLPRNTLLGYNFEIILANKIPGVLGFEGNVLLNPNEITYADLQVPTFFLAPSGSSVRVAHGSCRKLHGEGEDAMSQLDDVLRANVTNLGQRPPALHLTGDQIYADDVDGSIIGGLTMLGRTLLGFDELIPPDNKKVTDFGTGTRGFVRNFGFTVDENVSKNHLLGFGDYAAMYVLSWSPEIWSWSRLRQIPSFQQKAAKFSSAAIRRVLANMATYMICDDHEITDDWNLNPKWMRDTANPTARRILANGLAAYWAFQAIGNDPLSNRDSSLRSAVPTYLKGKGADPAPFENAIMNFHEWHYTAPTARPTVVLDTRTRRKFAPLTGDPDKSAIFNPPPGLMNDDAFAKMLTSLKQVGGSPDDPVLIVSPAPFIGYEKVEDLQRMKANIGMVTKPIDPEADPEAWSFNGPAFAQFLKVLAQSGKKRFVIFGGDVHYGYTAFASCTHRVAGQDTTIALVQVTSTAFRNEASGASFLGLDNVLSTDDDRHLMIGHPSGGDYFLQSAEFLMSHNLPLPANWDIQLRWKYPRMGSKRLIGRTNSVIPNNNAGIVTSDTAATTHTLHTAQGPHSVTIKWADILGQVPTPVAALTKAAGVP
jgi:hypothetical protein